MTPRSIFFLLIITTIKAEVTNNASIDDNFNGVYNECFLKLSYTCVQRKTLMYLNALNNLSEVSVIGDFVKFVKMNTTTNLNESIPNKSNNTDELTRLIDKAVDSFFDSHVIKFSGLGKSVFIPNGEEFVGRKKRKGGGGGGGGGGHDGGDGGKKKMMMMAMMCMKMKLMMMVPAMMGMMGMMSFKGMMFSMMSFMLSKMMLLMKILEKKGGAGGGLGGGGGDGGWAAGGAGGGAWMPAGGQDGGGYDSNGQWQGRAITEKLPEQVENKPVFYYVNPVAAYTQNNNQEPEVKDTQMGDKTSSINRTDTANRKKETTFYYAKNNVYESGIPKSRNKRSLLDLIQNSYLYWMNTLLGNNVNRRTSNFPKYKIVNGVKYVYYPYRQKLKQAKELQNNKIKTVEDSFTPIITAEDFNKGEIMEGGVESRMNKKKFNKMKDTVNDTIDDNPWE